MKRSLSKDQNLVFKTNYRLMQVKSIAECSKATFIKLPIVIKIFVLSTFEWPFYIGFTVKHNIGNRVQTHSSIWFKDDPLYI